MGGEVLFWLKVTGGVWGVERADIPATGGKRTAMRPRMISEVDMVSA